MFKKIILTASLIFSAHLFAHTDKAHVAVADAWVRATVAGQKGTGGFMKLTAREDLRLVRVSSPVAGVGEVHEMRMNANNVMEMRPVEGLDLPKGMTVELKPGGYHLMLMDLKQRLTKDSTVLLTLHFKNKNGQESKLDVKVPVDLQPSTGEASKPMHQH